MHDKVIVNDDVLCLDNELSAVETDCEQLTAHTQSMFMADFEADDIDNDNDGNEVSTQTGMKRKYLVSKDGDDSSKSDKYDPMSDTKKLKMSDHFKIIDKYQIRPSVDPFVLESECEVFVLDTLADVKCPTSDKDCELINQIYKSDDILFILTHTEACGGYCNVIDEFYPDVVIMYDADITLIRMIEVHQVNRRRHRSLDRDAQETDLKVYFLMYGKNLVTLLKFIIYMSTLWIQTTL